MQMVIATPVPIARVETMCRSRTSPDRARRTNSAPAHGRMPIARPVKKICRATMFGSASKRVVRRCTASCEPRISGFLRGHFFAHAGHRTDRGELAVREFTAIAARGDRPCGPDAHAEQCAVADEFELRRAGQHAAESMSRDPRHRADQHDLSSNDLSQSFNIAKLVNHHYRREVII